MGIFNIRKAIFYLLKGRDYSMGTPFSRLRVQDSQTMVARSEDSTAYLADRRTLTFLGSLFGIYNKV